MVKKTNNQSGIDIIVDNVKKTQPQVTQKVIDNIDKKIETDSPADWNKYKDKYGRRFDPEVHIKNKETGGPRINKKDGFITIKPGLGGKKTPAVMDPKLSDGFVFQKAPTAEILETDRQRQNYLQAAVIAAGMIEAGGVTCFSDEWRFIKYKQKLPGTEIEIEIDERQQFIEPLTLVFEKYNISDIPPGFALFAVSMTYISRRLNLPKTNSRLKNFGLRIKNATSWIYSKIKIRFARTIANDRE